MNTLLLDPSDVLFFRDGRPMGGSLSGHGAGWPLPTVTNAALHAALHRADLKGVHGHDHHRRNGAAVKDVRKFGGLLTAGPFPVMPDGAWLFPRPLDTGVTAKSRDGLERDSTAVSFLPLKGCPPSSSSLRQPLRYPVAAELPPTKAMPAPWWRAEAWNAYLDGVESTEEAWFHGDTSFCETEHSYGIGMDPETGTQDGERFYSAHYLRLKPGCRLGLLADCLDKVDGNAREKRDLISVILPNSGAKTPIIVGGQQRNCTVERRHSVALELPVGKTGGFEPQTVDGRECWLVKWILLSPSVFPQVGPHSGGWLPSWIRSTDGQVMLRSGNTARGESEGREAWRKRVAGYPEIAAKLVSAIVGKPVPISGYALRHEVIDEKGGAKPTHLAVPPGSVYYFECESGEAAEALAKALNWHGADLKPGTIHNRRSTLFGEKGFGLGVCGNWTFHEGNLP